MEIRRIEPELIHPPKASEHGTRADNERRPGGQSRQRRGHAGDEPEDEHAADAAVDETAPPARTYQPDGHLHQDDAPGGEHHAIDYKA